MFGRTSIAKSTRSCSDNTRLSGSQSGSDNIARLKQALEEADAVVIGAGVGLPTSAGFVYSGERFDPPKPVYENLFFLVKDKDYFVITTNVDHCFQKAGFDKKPDNKFIEDDCEIIGLTRKNLIKSGVRAMLVLFF